MGPTEAKQAKKVQMGQADSNLTKWSKTVLIGQRGHAKPNMSKWSQKQVKWAKLGQVESK